MNYYEMLLARKLAKGELPPNAYLLKTASGSLVSFSDGADLPMPSFICKIEAVQSGSGDPSPENVRPISGHTGVDAVISPTTDASAGTTIALSWQTEAGEVFGGYVDLVSGVLTVTHGIVNCKNLYFVPGSASAGGLNYADISISVGNTPISNKLKSVEKNQGWNSTAFCVSVNNDNKVRVYGRLSDFEDGGTYENTMVRYELATPITYQLTPQQIKSLLGNNNAWCDTGDATLEYFGKGAE